MHCKVPSYARRMEGDTGGVLTQLRKGVLEYCVLALLRREPSYGVDLAGR